MNTRRFTLLLLSLIALLALQAAARAVPVIVDFRGYLHEVTVPDTGLAVNDPIQGRLRYGTDAIAEVNIPEQIVYRESFQSLTLDILHAGSTAYSFSSNGGITMVVDMPTYYTFLAAGHEGIDGQFLGEEPIELLELWLHNDIAVPGATVDLPTQLSLDMFNTTMTYITVQVNDNDVLTAYITSLQTVPEPSTFALALLLLPALALYKRRLT